VYKPQPVPMVLQKKAVSFPHPANSPKGLQPQPAPQAHAPSPPSQFRATMSFSDRLARVRGGTIQAMLRHRNVGKKDEEPPSKPPSSSKVSSVSTEVTSVTFNEETAEAFNKCTGGADVKSEDKTFHMLPQDDRVWAVASGGTIEREYEALQAAHNAGMRTVLAGKMVKASIKTATGKTAVQDAFPMLWMTGAISSKSQAPIFISELKKLKSNKTTLTCLETIKEAAKKIDLQDFQVLLNPQTGEIVVNDPRGYSTPGSESTILKRVAIWEEALKDDSSSSSSEGCFIQ
jgi:hypothetical protein